MIRNKKDAKLLFILVILAHISIIPMICFASFHHYLISFIVYFFTGCLGMTMTYHRLLTHKSWNAPKWFEYFGSFCGIIGLTGSTIGWVAIHREHHHHTDTDKDPHSPTYKGFINSQWLSMFQQPKVRYVKDLINDKFHLFTSKNYFSIIAVYVSILFLIDPFAVIYAFLFPACILWNMGSFINTINHLFGYRTYDISDNSTNNFITGYLVWGEGWHNNHHNNPRSPYFGEKKYEIDVGSLLIKLLSK